MKKQKAKRRHWKPTEVIYKPHYIDEEEYECIIKELGKLFLNHYMEMQKEEIAQKKIRINLVHKFEY